MNKIGDREKTKRNQKKNGNFIYLFLFDFYALIKIRDQPEIKLLELLFLNKMFTIICLKKCSKNRVCSKNQTYLHQLVVILSASIKRKKQI